MGGAEQRKFIINGARIAYNDGANRAGNSNLNVRHFYNIIILETNTADNTRMHEYMYLKTTKLYI